MNDKYLILASSSPYRKQQLEKLQVEFSTHPPNIDETNVYDKTPENLAEHLSIEKAKTVYSHLAPSASKKIVVIGSDQTLECEGILFGKPGDKKTASKQLRHFSGQTAIYYSGIAIITENLSKSRVVKTTIKFRNLSSSDIDSYLSKEDVLNCAGSIKTEGMGIRLIDSMTSMDHTAILGLPMITLTSWLLELDIDPLTTHP